MGTIDRRLYCSTCGESIAKCPGHIGHIELPWPCYHIGFVDVTLKALRSICFFCARVNIIGNGRGTGRHLLTNVHTTCKGRKKCVHCDAPQPCYSKTPCGISASWPGDTVFASQDEQVYCKRVAETFSARHVQSILSSCQELHKLGFTTSHPKDFIMDVLVVAPPCARPAVMVSEGSRSRGQVPPLFCFHLWNPL